MRHPTNRESWRDEDAGEPHLWPRTSSVPTRRIQCHQLSIPPLVFVLVVALLFSRVLFNTVPPPPAPVAKVAPAPTPATPKDSSLQGGEVAQGVALGALPWLAAPVVALAAVRPLLQQVSLSLRLICRTVMFP